MPGLQVQSGVGTVSGFVSVNALPISIFQGSGAGSLSSFSGSDGLISLNVNLSGGTISANVSGNVVRIASSGSIPISDYSGALNVNISGGTIASNVSGNVVRIASSGSIPITDFSGALNVNISGGSISTTPPGLQSGSMQLISGGQLALSGLFVEISGQVLAISSGGTVPISNVSGVNASNTYVITLSGQIGGSGIGNIIGIYNPGPLTVELSRLWIYSNTANPGTIFYIQRTSGGVLSGLGIVPLSLSTRNPSSQVSGYVLSGVTPVSGIIAASGTVILDFAQAVQSLYFDKVYRLAPYLQGIIANSGEGIVIGMESGNTNQRRISMFWIER